MDWLWTTISVVVVLALCLISQLRNTKKLPLPPGPAGFPILGSLPSLGKNPHLDLHHLSRKYGPIMYLRLGLVPTVVVSSAEYAEQFLKIHDLVFANRPPHEGSRLISYGQRNLTFAPYGPYWRFIRKKCMLELLNVSKMNSHRPMRREEIGLLIEYLKKAAANRATVNLSAKALSTGADMSCRMVFGRKYLDKEFNEKGFKAMIQETLQLGGAPNIGDFIPCLSLLDFQGLGKKLKNLSAVFDVFFEKIIDDHVDARAEGRESKDFVDSMLAVMEEQENTEFRIGRSHIKALMLDMLAASVDTSGTAIDWAMVELIRNPHVMKKLQHELESVVGLDRVVEESDLEGLDYLDKVIKETFRLHPPAPLLLPHESTEECIIDGCYLIPAKSRLIVNVWSIGRDPSVWSDPEKFVPERFEGSSMDVLGHDFQLLPFGAGRRGCPGMQLGLTLVRLMVAQLVHCFDWELPNGRRPCDLDMREEFGITVPRAEPLVVVPSYRLRM